MRADADPDRRRHQVALVVGEPQHEPVRLLGPHRLGHGAEVPERPGREVVALGRVRVEVVERLEVRRVAPRDDHAGLVGLLDVAAPLLVHARQQVGLGARAAVLAHERDLEVVAGLAGREAAVGALEPPAEVVQLRDHPRPDGLPVGGGEVVEAAYGGIGDALLDPGGRPAPGDHGRSHPDRERALLLEVPGHRCEPGAEIGGPVDDRTLGEVRQRARQPGQVAVQHQSGADQVGPVEPAQRLRPPLRLHRRPRRRLEEAGPRLRAHERQVLLPADRPDGGGARHLSRLSGCPSPVGRGGRAATVTRPGDGSRDLSPGLVTALTRLLDQRKPEPRWCGPLSRTTAVLRAGPSIQPGAAQLWLLDRRSSSTARR